jgi:hypothetical protein
VFEVNVRSVTLPSPQGVVLGLEVVSVKHRVVGLFSAWADHVESSSDLGSLLDLVYWSARLEPEWQRAHEKSTRMYPSKRPCCLHISIGLISHTKTHTVDQPVESSDGLHISFCASIMATPAYLLHGDGDIRPDHQLRSAQYH